MIGVTNEKGKLVGVFAEQQFADALVNALHSEQMEKVGYIAITYRAAQQELPMRWTANTYVPRQEQRG